MKVGVLKNDELDKERIDRLRLLRNEDIFDDCAKESRGETANENATIDTFNFSNDFFFQLQIKKNIARWHIFSCDA